MAATISCAIDGADTTGMQVTLRCKGYSLATFKGYGYVDGGGQIGHDMWQFRGSRSSTAMEFLEEDESRIWVMAFDTGSSYPVTDNFFASEFEDKVKNTCFWPSIEINFTFGKGDQVLISLQLGQQSYTCSRTIKNTLQSRDATNPSSSSRDSAAHRQQSYRAGIRSPSELTGKQGHRVRQSSPTARPPSTEEENSVLVPRQYKIVPMPSCSKSIAERTDRLEQHKDKLKDWLSNDKKGKYQRIWEQKTFPLTWSREMESAEILLKLSRVSVSPAQVTTSCSLEIEDGIECGTVSPGTSSEGHSTKHPGTSSADIISWVDHVNELLVEYPCLPVPEMSPPTGPPGNVEISEVNWEDNKRTASDCDEDTIVVEVPETKRSRRTRLSKICEET